MALKNPDYKDYLLCVLSVTVIILSIFNLGFRITGNSVSSSSSIINITVLSSASINFTIDSINFGSGSITTGKSSATLDTIGNVVNGNWTPVSEGFRVENIGNINLTLNLKSGKTAAEFVGGTNPLYQYNVTNHEGGSCISGSFVFGQWTSVNTTGTGTGICDEFGYLGANNSIDIDLRITIPSDASLGSKEDIFTATGTSI